MFSCNDCIHCPICVHMDRVEYETEQQLKDDCDHYQRQERKISRYEKIMGTTLYQMANSLSKICKNTDGCYHCIFSEDCPSSEAPEDWVKWLSESEDTQ